MEKLRMQLIEGFKKLDIRYQDVITDNLCDPKSITICEEKEIIRDGIYVCKALDKYRYIYVERGKHTVMLETEDLDKILYAIYEDIVFDVATQYELDNRKEGEDFRRQLFSKEKELLGKINSKYAEMYQEEIDRILEKRPYADNAF